MYALDGAPRDSDRLCGEHIGGDSRLQERACFGHVLHIAVELGIAAVPFALLLTVLAARAGRTAGFGHEATYIRRFC